MRGANMQIESDAECSGLGFFVLPECKTAWNLFKKSHIFPFMREKMQVYNYEIKCSEKYPNVTQNVKPYKELLDYWRDSKSANINAEILQDIDLYLDFISTFIIDIICKDCVKKHLKLKDSVYKHIKSLHSRNLYLELVFVDDEAMQDINKEYMHKDYPTDVLSFPLITQDAEIRQCFGSIIINLCAVCDRADFYKHNMYSEISLLFIHAFLHLLGFDHENDSGEQRIVEKEIIAALNLPKSLIIRTEHANNLSITD